MGQNRQKAGRKATNKHVNALCCLPYETNPIPKFNSAVNVASENSDGPRSMSQGLAIVN